MIDIDASGIWRRCVRELGTRYPYATVLSSSNFNVSTLLLRYGRSAFPVWDSTLPYFCPSAVVFALPYHQLRSVVLSVRITRCLIMVLTNQMVSTWTQSLGTSTKALGHLQRFYRVSAVLDYASSLK